MYGFYRPLNLVLLFLLSLSDAQSSESVEFFYFVNQRAFLVDEFEEGLPKLSNEVDPSGLSYEGRRHQAWWYDGSLPLTADYASPIVDYRLKRVAQPFAERDLEARYRLELDWNQLLVSLGIKEIDSLDRFAVGWVFDGKIQHIVLVPGADKIDSNNEIEAVRFKNWSVSRNAEIADSEKSGYALLWRLRNGVLVKRAQRAKWDWLVGNADSPQVGVELLETDAKGRSEIFYAAAKGDEQAVERLLNAQKELIEEKDDEDRLPIRYAVENGRTEVVKLLAERDSKLEDGWGELNSVVMLAASAGHFEIVKLLVPEKPRGSKAKWHCSWAAIEAVNNNYEDISDYLMPFDPKIDFGDADKKMIVLNKLSQGYPKIGFSLMERLKVKPDFDVNGVTALHSVAGYADEALLDQVRGFGIKPQSLTKNGIEALDFAIGGGNVEGICWFLDNREDRIDDEALAAGFLHAINENRIASVECLLGYGYDLDVEIAKDVSPVVFAIIKRRFDIAALLFERGARIDPDSLYWSLVVARVIEGDRPDLLGQLEIQGLDWRHSVFDDLSILSTAEAVDAEKILEYLDERAIDAGLGGSVIHVSQVEEAPQLLSKLSVTYPDELRERFGSRSEVVEIIISKSGEPLFAIPQNEFLPTELFELIESAITDLKFNPAKISGEAVSVSILTRVPLKADFEMTDVFSISDVDEKPQAVKYASPRYPSELRQNRIDGDVVVTFILMPNGMVRDVRPIEFTHKAFVNPAISCVLQTLWSPATRNGKPVACRVKIPVSFRVN